MAVYPGIHSRLSWSRTSMDLLMARRGFLYIYKCFRECMSGKRVLIWKDIYYVLTVNPEHGCSYSNCLSADRFLIITSLLLLPKPKLRQCFGLELESPACQSCPAQQTPSIHSNHMFALINWSCQLLLSFLVLTLYLSLQQNYSTFPKKT